MTIIEKGIGGLRSALGLMAAAAQDSVDLMLRVLETGSPEARDAVLQADLQLNQFELKLDHMCEHLLALQEPYAVDFRTIFAAIKTTRDLERVGDESKLVARWAARAGKPASEAIRELARTTREVLADAVVALRTEDADRARAVMAADGAVDDLEAHILDTTSDVPEAFMAHALERIGDRAKNIAENVIYVVSAEDVRHPRPEAR